MSATAIRTAMNQVAHLRSQQRATPGLLAWVQAVKRFQTLRFEAAYRDLLHEPRYASAVRFFLQELYSPRDYSDRDAQFARIAAAIERLFPQTVVSTAVTLAQVHAMTEQLDTELARVLLAAHGDTAPQEGCVNVTEYVPAFTKVGTCAQRHEQLAAVVTLGQQLDRLTRTPGLRGLLRMMRMPASASGLSALQRFLEAGFDTFSGMGGASAFLRTIHERESGYIDRLFQEPEQSMGELSRLLK